MNLINDRWIPVIRQNNEKDIIAPWQIAETDNPVIEINAPRADFQGALYQFLIGLLQTCFAPKDEDDWLENWEETPSKNDIKEAFEKVAFAFELDSQDGINFMQEHPATNKHKEEFTKAEYLPIEDLVGGALSKNTRKENKDLFVKSSTIQVISPYFAALGLFNMQITGVLAWGKHRVGLRSNGPLTTLVLPDDKNGILWHKLWLNIIDNENLDLIPGDLDKNKPSDIFPWLAQTRISPKKEPTSPSDTHPLQHYWPMPRRIILKFESVNCICDLTGIPIKKGVSHYQRVSNGIYYTNGWVHPLTPYTRVAKDKFPKPVEGGVAGEGFRQWVTLNYGEYADEDNKKMRWGRALAVKHFYESTQVNIKTKLWCFGYNASNANVKCWYESTMPTFNLSTDEVDALKSHASKVIQIAHQLLDELIFSIIRAWFKPQTDSQGKHTWKHIKSSIKKSGHLSTYTKIDADFWSHLESAFPPIIEELIDYGNKSGQPLHIYGNWLKTIQKYCLSYFDQNVLNNAVDDMDMKRVVEAKSYLLSALYPNKKGTLKDINEFNKQQG